MLQSRCRRRFLWIISAGTLVGIFIGIAPSVLERFASSSNPMSPLLAILKPSSANHEIETSSTGTETGSDLLVADYSNDSEAVVNVLTDRRLQQASIVADELAARERDVAIREAALLGRMNSDFWKRQLPAAAATIALTMVLVMLVLNRAMSKDGIRLRLRDEETKLRNLQLSVIGSLEEFERNLADARVWVAAESSKREHDHSRPQMSNSPSPRSSHSMAAEPPAPRPINTVEMIRDEEPNQSRQSELPNSTQTSSAAWSASHEAFIASSPEASQKLPDSVSPEDNRGSWTRRFVEPVTQRETDLMNDDSKQRGPWGEPVRRSAEPPAPQNRPPLIGRTPGLREQVEYLAAEGFSEAEIAKHLSVSRDEVSLALQMRVRLPKPIAQRSGLTSDQSAVKSTPESVVDAWDSSQWGRHEQAK